VEHEAVPDVTATEVHIAVAPSKKLTVPVAGPAGPETFAVKLTLAPAVDGFSEEANATAGVAVLTCCETPFDVAAL
jgi:hypothetical protein